MEMIVKANSYIRAVKGVGLRQLACWDCGFESRRRHGCLSLVSVVCCRYRSLRPADHLSRGVLPSVVSLSVIAKPSKMRPLYEIEVQNYRFPPPPQRKEC